MHPVSAAGNDPPRQLYLFMLGPVGVLTTGELYIYIYGI